MPWPGRLRRVATLKPDSKALHAGQAFHAYTINVTCLPAPLVPLHQLLLLDVPLTLGSAIRGACRPTLVGVT